MSCDGMLLSVYPTTANFVKNGTGKNSEHAILNKTLKRIAFKLQCSNNRYYCTSVTRGFVEPGGKFEFYIRRDRDGPAGFETLFVLFADVSEEETDVDAPFVNVNHTGIILGEMNGHFKIILSAAE